MEKRFTRLLLILSGLFLCPVLIFAQGQIAGNVLYHGTSPIPNVTVTLKNANNIVVGTTSTNYSGYYEFNNMQNGTYTIHFTDNNPAGGVNLQDAFMVLFNVLHLITFDESQLLAADVNGSGSVTFTDYVFILVNYLTQGQMFPIGPWVFESERVVLGGSRNSFTTSVGSSTGDANGTFVPTKNGEVELECSSSNSISVQPAGEFNLGLYSDQDMDLAGMYLVFEIPEGLHFRGLTQESSDVNYYCDGQEVRISWIDPTAKGISVNHSDPLVMLTLIADSQLEADQTLQLTMNPISHFIDDSGDLIHNVSLNMASVLIRTNSPQPVTNQCVYPNPCSESTNIEYTINESSHLSIDLYNANGQLVKDLIDEFQSAGFHKISFPTTDLTPGIYYYKVITSGNSEYALTGKIIKSK